MPASCIGVVLALTKHRVTKERLHAIVINYLTGTGNFCASLGTMTDLNDVAVRFTRVCCGSEPVRLFGGQRTWELKSCTHVSARNSSQLPDLKVKADRGFFSLMTV